MYQLSIDGSQHRLYKDVITIGRSPECDIHIPVYQISRYHAELRNTKAGWRIESTGRNGTYLNGEPVTSALLADCDVLRFDGSQEATFERIELVSEQTLWDTPTTPPAVASQIERLEQQIARSSEESQQFHQQQTADLKALAAEVHSLSSLWGRVDALEKMTCNLGGTDKRVFAILEDMEERARKATSVLLGGVALIGFVAFATVVFDEAERHEFREAIMEAVGGPTGVASALVTALGVSAAWATKPGKKNDRLVGEALRLVSTEPEVGGDYGYNHREFDRIPGGSLQREFGDPVGYEHRTKGTDPNV